MLTNSSKLHFALYLFTLSARSHDKRHTIVGTFLPLLMNHTYNASLVSHIELDSPPNKFCFCFLSALAKCMIKLAVAAIGPPIGLNYRIAHHACAENYFGGILITVHGHCDEF